MPDAWFVAIALTVLVLVSLWPLGCCAKRFVGSEPHRSRIRLESRSDGLETILGVVTAAGGTVERVVDDAGWPPRSARRRPRRAGARRRDRDRRSRVALAEIDGVSLTRSALDPD